MSAVFQPFQKAFLAGMRGVDGGVAPIVYLLRDEFTTDDAAPLESPRSCEPGPGIITKIVDTNNKISISGGKLVHAPQANVLDPAYKFSDSAGNAFTRAAGLTLLVNVTISLSTDSFFGWINAANTRIYSANYQSAGETRLAYSGSGTTKQFNINTKTAPYTEDFHIILRTSGAFLVMGSKLLWVFSDGTDATLFAGFANRNTTMQNDYVRAAVAGAPWADTYGPGSAIVGTITAPQAFTHEPNFTGYFTVTNRGTAGNTDYPFRQQDATNYWQLLIASDGSGVLNEVVAGTPTSRGSFAANIVTNGERCAVQANGTTIRVMDATETRITYASATNFQTATSGQLAGVATGGTITTLETYPIDLSGAALSALAVI